MYKSRMCILAVLITLLLGAFAAGCGAPPPTEEAAIEPIFATRATSPASATPLPPTPAPTNTVAPTVTQIPPTPEPAGHRPEIEDLADFSISDGERFPKIQLDTHVFDEDHEADEIEWHITGNEELEVRLIGRNLFVSLPHVDWTGSETLHFEACDPGGLCASEDVLFVVRAENDAPVVSIGGQIIMPGEAFAEVVLEESGYDEDNAADELSWNVSGNKELDVSVHDGIVRIEPRDPSWLGSETIRFEACDPGGACGSKEASLWVMEREESQVEVTYIGNAGFMIALGDKKILIDALCERPSPPRDVAEALVAAQPPFQDVDLILVTHVHDDHFSAERVRSHLESNPGATFVAGQDAVNAVVRIGDVQDQVIPIRLQQRAGERTHLVVDGIGLEAIYLSHGGPILNLGYLITTEGRRLFHTGDMDPDTVRVSELERHGLPEKQIDIAFVAHFMLITEEQHAHVVQGIQAQHIVPMHYQFTYPPPDYELMASYFPDAIVFHEAMETWVLPGTSPKD